MNDYKSPMDYQWANLLSMQAQLNNLSVDQMDLECDLEEFFSNSQIKEFRNTICSLVAMSNELSNLFVKYYKKSNKKTKVTYKDLKKFVSSKIDDDNAITLVLNFNRRLMYCYMKSNGDLTPEQKSWINKELFKEIRQAARKSNNKVKLFDTDEMIVLHEDIEE